MKPKNRKLFRYAVDTFITVLRQVTKRPKFEYRCNDNDVKSWNNFIENYRHDNIGEEFVRKYVEYGFQSWWNPSSQHDVGKSIRFSWVFGAPAIKRWNALGQKTNVEITRKIIKSEHKINAIKYKSDIPSLLLFNRTEEIEKARYHNKRAGFQHCISMTTLYNHSSELCQSCDKSELCKQTLKENYPKVYKKRGYAR